MHENAAMTGKSAFLGLTPAQYGLPESLCADIELIDRLLGELLLEQEGPDLLALARRLSANPDGTDTAEDLERLPELGDARNVQRLLRAFTMLFQLLNSAEQKEIVRANWEREKRAGSGPRSESIAEAVRVLHDAGASASEVQDLLDRVDVCPTLTAHPSEARRRSVLDKLEKIAHGLVERGGESGPRFDEPVSAAATEEALVRTLTALWQTDELRATRLTVTDEVTNALYFFERSILDVVAWLHEDLRAALAENYPGVPFRVGPFVRYRSWVGGDRDGNPNVTADLTWTTLTRHKTLVLEHYIARVDALRRELTQSVRLVPVSAALMASLEEDARCVALGQTALDRYRYEPYALKLVYIQVRLEATLRHVRDIAGLRTDAPAASGAAYAHAQALLDDLLLIETSLREHRGRALSDAGALRRLVSQVMTFGFHLAGLDIRQHSDEHADAIAAMLHAARLLPSHRRYDELTEDEKVRLLRRELANPRPLLPHHAGPEDDEAREVLEVFEVMRAARRALSPEAVSTYVISMTHGVSDILEVLLLAKEVGLVRWRAEGEEARLDSDIDVVPLFETIEDLTRCDALMRKLLADASYRQHLGARGGLQEIMLGYSDSTKDGGFTAANVTLYEAQARLAEACRAAGVRVRFFHGRGGTVGRGGGRANRAILSQPPGSFDGSIRFTEQGEVISFRYGAPAIGHRHMEQIVNAALLAVSPRTGGQHVRPEWRRAMKQMAERSLAVYRELVHDDPSFWDFYRQATPIQHISRLPIASRPASRGRQPADLEALRAIPWVFAWVQSRYVVPGWYGLGSALESFGGEAPEKLALLARMYREWLFFRMVMNNAQLELLRAHLPTAAGYARRVQPRELGERIHERIAREHRLTREWILRITEQPDLLEHAPVVRRTVELRNPAMRPLSLLQVLLLDRLGGEPQQDGGEGEEWEQAMLLSIAGIAAAMQSTG
jgi:phosphoenolpyruvate carboxylase